MAPSEFTQGTEPAHVDADQVVSPAQARAGSVAGLESPDVDAGKGGDRDDQADAMTKAELAELLFEQVGLNKREAKDMIDAFFDEIHKALERGESVKLSGFGNFQLRDKPARPGRNPKTGEIVPISARRVVTFHPSQKLKDMIEEGQ